MLIRLGAIREEQDQTQRAALFVPTAAANFFAEKVASYGTEVPEGNAPSIWRRFDGTEELRAGSLETLWTGARGIPGTGDKPFGGKSGSGEITLSGSSEFHARRNCASAMKNFVFQR